MILDTMAGFMRRPEEGGKGTFSFFHSGWLHEDTSLPLEVTRKLTHCFDMSYSGVSFPPSYLINNLTYLQVAL